MNLGFLPALCNTVPSASESGVDELASSDTLRDFLTSWKFSGHLDTTEAELDAVRATRHEIRDIWGADELTLAAWVNTTLATARAIPQLVDHDGLGWHIHAVDHNDPLARRILAEAAMSFIDVIRGGRLDRLRACEADDCEGVVADLSKNGSKRFCSTRCGNRMAVRAYRARAHEA